MSLSSLYFDLGAIVFSFGFGAIAYAIAAGEKSMNPLFVAFVLMGMAFMGVGIWRSNVEDKRQADKDRLIDMKLDYIISSNGDKILARKLDVLIEEIRAMRRELNVGFNKRNKRNSV